MIHATRGHDELGPELGKIVCVFCPFFESSAKLSNSIDTAAWGAATASEGGESNPRTGLTGHEVVSLFPQQTSKRGERELSVDRKVYVL